MLIDEDKNSAKVPSVNKTPMIDIIDLHCFMEYEYRMTALMLRKKSNQVKKENKPPKKTHAT